MKFIFIFCVFVTACAAPKEGVPTGPVRVFHMMKDGIGVQYTFPWKRSEQKTCEPVTVQVSSFKITYECYGDKRVAVVSIAGICIETILLVNYKPEDVIVSNLKQVIMPEKSTSEIRITYLWKSRGQQSKRCRTKKYKVKVEIRTFYGTVENLKLEDVDCPLGVNKFLTSIGNPANFGVENLLGKDSQIVHDMDYYLGINEYKLDKTETPSFKVSDPQGNGYKLICPFFSRIDSDNPNQPPPGYPTAEGDKVAGTERNIWIESIVFEENKDVVIERFRGVKCYTQTMNINRKILSPDTSEFTFVFTDVLGNCYSRVYEQSVRKNELVEETTIHRKKLECIKCPKVWVGKIENEAIFCGYEYNISALVYWMRKKTGREKDLEP